MNNIMAALRSYWERRTQIPKGVWILLLAYSLVALGSPMPPKITWLEIVMGAGLLIGGKMLVCPVIREARQQSLAKLSLILTVLLFFIPLCVGLLRGNALADMVRDIFPLAFLILLPILIVYSIYLGSRTATRVLMTMVLVFVGICTAAIFFVGVLKLFGSVDNIVMTMRGGLGVIDATQATQADFLKLYDPLILKLYDPSMLFAAIFLSAWGCIFIVRSWRGLLPGLILASIGALITYGFMILGLRAYTFLFVLAILTVSVTKWRERGFYIRLLPAFLITCVVLWPQITAVLQLLWVKQQVTGTNGKAAEWLAVLTTITATPQTMLFGIGWGGIFENPILGMRTRFTHSMLSFYLLKTGVIGLGILITVIGLLLNQRKRARENEDSDISRLILLVSCLPPLLIGMLFEPTYKTLSYGVILSLFALVLSSFWKKVQ